MSAGRMPWTEANAKGCQAMDPSAHLAAIINNNRAFLSKQEAFFGVSGYWVGLRLSDSEWNQGSAYATRRDDTINWSSVGFVGPSHVGDPTRDCVYMDSNALWFDGPCSNKNKPLCELKQVRVHLDNELLAG